MADPRIGVVVVAQNDAETIERSVSSYYPYVEAALVSNDPERGWSGKAITPDDTLERVRALDRERKITVVQRDFYQYPDPNQNDTAQRQVSADILAHLCPGLDWILQIDADEEFLDFPAVVSVLSRLARFTYSVYWRWIQIFNRLDDGRYLVVVEAEGGRPALEKFPLAHRPNAKLKFMRRPRLPIRDRFLNRVLRMEYDPGTQMPLHQGVLHYSYAKSEARIQEKLSTWSHARDFDTETFFALWQRSKTDWGSIKDFHPTQKSMWPALRPFTLEELRDTPAISAEEKY